MGEDYIKLEDLKVYRLAMELCDMGWEMYEPLDWLDKKTMGEQFIRSTDSVAANIAEGYGRYHYLDRIKFCYNARGSLLEVKHWIFLLHKREKINKDQFDNFLDKANHVHLQLNIYIKSLYASKNKDTKK